MAYTQLASGSWGSDPAIPYTFYYEKSRSGTSMIYKIKVVLGTIGSQYFGYPINCNINCGGKTASTQMKAASPSQWSSPLTYETGNLTVANKTSGTTSLTITLTGVGAPRGSTNYVYNLPINPAASSVRCVGGNIGEATTIKINKSAEAYTHTLTYSFRSLSGTIATKTSESEVIWTIPTDFFAAMTDMTSDICTVSCTTYNGNTTLGTTTCQFYVSVSEDSMPTMNPTVMDIRSATIALTGDANILIFGESTAKCQMNAQAKDGATIESVTIQTGNGAEKFNTQTATIYNTRRDDFIFDVVDSRGFRTSQYVTKPMIFYYNPPTCALTFNEFTSEGDVSITITGSAWNGNFGVANNTLAVQYRYKKNSDEWGSWTDATVSWNNDGTYQTDLTLQNFDYRAQYTFQARAKDAIHTEGILSNTSSKKALPLFYWDAENFNFNIPLSIQGDELVDFVIEEGTSWIWNYRKWRSGIAEFWCRYRISGWTCNTPVGSWYKTYEIPMPNYPHAFIEAPKLNMYFESRSGTGGILWPTNYDEVGENSALTAPNNVYVIRMTPSDSINGYINVHAIGKIE